MIFRKKLCGREDLFSGLHLNLEEKWNSADEKAFFFWSSPEFSGKITSTLSDCKGGHLVPHFPKGAIVQKGLKTTNF